MSNGVGALAAVAFLALCSQCGKPSSGGGAQATTSTAGAPKTSLGNVMADVARRFELTGRAFNANRFELAEFEVGELEELFENDVPGAELPKEGPTAHIPAMSKAFLQANVPELKKAAAGKDRAAFAAAFQQASAACNGCHLASAKGFIQVPSVPGKTVPDLEPIPATSASAAPPAASR